MRRGNNQNSDISEKTFELVQVWMKNLEDFAIRC